MPATELERIKKITGVQLAYLDPVVANHLFVNYHNGAKEADKPEQPKFKVMRDAKFRQALVYALDIPNLIKVADPTGQTDEWHCALSPSVADQCAKDLASYAYNPDKAKALLKEAGWDSTWELDFVSLNAPPPFYEIVQQLWAKVGVKANIRQVDIANFIAEFYGQGKFDVIISGQGRWIRAGSAQRSALRHGVSQELQLDAVLQQGLRSAVRQGAGDGRSGRSDRDHPADDQDSGQRSAHLFSLDHQELPWPWDPRSTLPRFKLGSGYNWGITQSLGNEVVTVNAHVWGPDGDARTPNIPLVARVR